MVELKNVSKFYNNSGVVTIGLRNVSLNFNRGEIVAITGESGSGKSTLLNVICGVDSYEEGEILFQGNETSYFNEEDRDAFRRKNVAFIYQEYNVIDSATVLENIMMPLLVSGVSWKAAKEKAATIAAKVGLEGRLKSRGSTLSGGEKQRCVIARALATDAPILACDEPTGNLDSETGKEIVSLIKEVSGDKLVLIVTHNYPQVERIVTRKVRLHDGNVVEDTVRPAPSGKKAELAVTENKLGFKSQSLLTLRNIANTPKKSIFSLSVLTVFSFFALMSMLLISYSSAFFSFNVNAPYGNVLPERMVVYNDDHSPLNMESISGALENNDYYTNAFYEDVLADFYGPSTSIYCTTSTRFPERLQGIKGVKTLNSGEAFVVFSSYPEYRLNRTHIELGDRFICGRYRNDSVRVVGYGYCDELNTPLMVLNERDVWRVSAEAVFSNKITYAGDSLNGSYSAYRSGGDKFLVSLPGILSNDADITFSLAGIYDFTLRAGDYDVDNTYDYECRIEIPDDFTPERVFSSVYEVVIYTKDKWRTAAAVTAAGSSYEIPSELIDDGANSIAQRVARDYIVFNDIAAFLLLSLVGFVIMRGVYKTKTKEFTILRSLGFTKKQLKRMVEGELAAIALVACVMGVVILLIISLFWDVAAAMVSYIDVFILIAYFLTMQLFAYIISGLFNTSLFKLTVKSTIREAEL